MAQGHVGRFVGSTASLLGLAIVHIQQRDGIHREEAHVFRDDERVVAEVVLVREHGRLLKLLVRPRYVLCVGEQVLAAAEDADLELDLAHVVVRRC